MLTLFSGRWRVLRDAYTRMLTTAYVKNLTELADPGAEKIAPAASLPAAVKMLQNISFSGANG